MLLDRTFTEKQNEEQFQILTSKLFPSTIFVFGSNLAGRHGAGAAKYAMQHYGAKYGVGYGLTGQAYALPTKDWDIDTLPLSAIQVFVYAFIGFARHHPELHFLITRIGCGLAGYKDLEIAPMFIGSPTNCHFYEEWKNWLPKQSVLGPSPRS